MSNLPFTKAHLSQLSGFIDLCKKDPKILLNPELSFFKSYIESMGGKIPANLFKTDFGSPKTNIPEPKKEREPEPDADAESVESDIELDNSGIIGRYIYSFTYLYILLIFQL
jgi:suppressor of tumorigenicity protein 13